MQVLQFHLTSKTTPKKEYLVAVSFLNVCLNFLSEIENSELLPNCLSDSGHFVNESAVNTKLLEELIKSCSCNV